MTTKFYDHWRDVPDTKWRWPNFSPAEIASRGDGKLLINEPALDKLQALRDRLGKPLIVRSAYRSPEHNRAVGGAKRSKHLIGAAFDIAMENHDPVMFEAAAREVGFLGFGFYPRSGELLSNLVFEALGSCSDLVWFGGFNSVFEFDACDDFGEIVKAA